MGYDRGRRRNGNLLAIAGACGADRSAAHKRCKRGLVLLALHAKRDAGVDIAPRVAERVFKRLIGRGVDEQAAAFATPGRTAAHRSVVGADDLVELETELLEKRGAQKNPHKAGFS